MEPAAGEVCAVLRQAGEQGLIAAGTGFDFAFGAVQRGHLCQGHAEQNPFCLIAGAEFPYIDAPIAAAGGVAARYGFGFLLGHGRGNKRELWRPGARRGCGHFRVIGRGRDLHGHGAGCR